MVCHCILAVIGDTNRNLVRVLINGSEDDSVNRKFTQLLCRVCYLRGWKEEEVRKYIMGDETISNKEVYLDHNKTLLNALQTMNGNLITNIEFRQGGCAIMVDCIDADSKQMLLDRQADVETAVKTTVAASGMYHEWDDLIVAPLWV